MDSHSNEKGSALAIALLLVIVIAGYSASFLSAISTSQRSSRASTERVRAQYLAEAIHSVCVADRLPGLAPGTSDQLGNAATPRDYGGGDNWANATRNNSGLYEISAHGRAGSEEVEIVASWRRPSPLRDFAIFAGGSAGVLSDPIEFGGLGNDADVIRGNVYVNGDVRMTGDSEVVGDVSTTGDIFNDVNINGNPDPFTSPIEPPDLRAMDYANNADFVINSSTSFDVDGNLPETDPRHFFVKEFDQDSLAPDPSFVFDNTNYFFGDPYEDSNLGRVSVSSAGNRKTYFVDGNLWIEGKNRTDVNLVNSPSDGTVITIVARGNIYFADGVGYDNDQHDGILFVALGDGESYTDQDGDNQYDVGEPILNDNGDGIYNGATEGSGNVYFGDPNDGPVGHVNGFLYAENNFEDHVNNHNGTASLEFEITGFMSAGNQVVINRDFSGGGHAGMTVNLDERLSNGQLEFPDFPGEPGGGGSTKWALVGWRIRYGR